MIFPVREYLKIARPDHWLKHVFILPGIIIALKLVNTDTSFLYITIVMGISSACLLSSANYVINEWLDADFDRYHPKKKHRPAVAGTVSALGVYIAYFLLVISGLSLAWQVNTLFFLCSITFLFLALLYNVSPFRFKDINYLDVLTEALNNPIRLLMGWSIVSDNTIPPFSVLVFFWFGGAFLMSAKRLAEMRYMDQLGQSEQLYLYRPGFKTYTERALMTCAYMYSILASFNIAVFLVKYRPEYILSYPLVAVLFAYYFFLSLTESSIVQTPEKLYSDKRLILIVLGLAAMFLFLSYVDLPFANQYFVELTVPTVNIQF